MRQAVLTKTNWLGLVAFSICSLVGIGCRQADGGKTWREVRASIIWQEAAISGNQIGAEFDLQGKFAVEDACAAVVRLSQGQSPASTLPGRIAARLYLPSGKEWPIKQIIWKGSLCTLRIPKGYDVTPDFMTLVLTPEGQSEQEIGRFRITKFAPAELCIKPEEPRMKAPRWKLHAIGGLKAELEVNGNRANSVSRIDVLRTTHVKYPPSSAGGSSQFAIRSPGDTRHKNYSTLEAGIRDIELHEIETSRISKMDAVRVPGISLEEHLGKAVLSVDKDITVKTDLGNIVKVPTQRARPVRAGQSLSRGVELRLQYRFLKPGLGSVRPKVVTALNAFGVSSIRLFIDCLQSSAEGTNQSPIKPFSTSIQNQSFGKTKDLKKRLLPPLILSFEVTQARKTGEYKGIISVSNWTNSISEK